MTKGNLAWSGVWSDEFTIEFDVIVTSELTDTWHNIFHVTTGDNCCKLGDRIPAHTPLEGLSGFGQFPRQMAFTQLFFGISGTQNRRDQNFLTRTFSVEGRKSLHF